MQAGLHFCCWQTPEDRFSHVKVHIALGQLCMQQTLTLANWILFLWHSVSQAHLVSVLMVHTKFQVFKVNSFFFAISLPLPEKDFFSGDTMKMFAIVLIVMRSFQWVIWALMQENLSSEVCKQQRCRQACASLQSDLRVYYSLNGSYTYHI